MPILMLTPKPFTVPTPTVEAALANDIYGGYLHFDDDDDDEDGHHHHHVHTKTASSTCTAKRVAKRKPADRGRVKKAY